MSNKGYKYTAEDIKKYREETGASMAEAHRHFQVIEDERRLSSMLVMVDRGDMDDIREVLKFLLKREMDRL